MNLIEGIVFLFIGISVIVFTFFVSEPVEILQNGNQISASLNATFVVLIMAGSFFIGAGVAQSAITSTIYKVEKEMADNTHE